MYLMNLKTYVDLWYSIRDHDCIFDYPYLFQLKRRLTKEFSEKEADLASKNEQLQELRAEHGIVVVKVSLILVYI